MESPPKRTVNLLFTQNALLFGIVRLYQSVSLPSNSRGHCAEQVSCFIVGITGRTRTSRVARVLSRYLLSPRRYDPCHAIAKRLLHYVQAANHKCRLKVQHNSANLACQSGSSRCLHRESTAGLRCGARKGTVQMGSANSARERPRRMAITLQGCLARSIW